MKHLLVVGLMVMGLATTSCASNTSKNTQNDGSTSNETTTTEMTQSTAAKTQPISGAELDKLTAFPDRLLVIETKFGTMKLQLFEKLAPKHVANIIKLAKSGFFDGITFHRVIPKFMIQGGDPNSKDDDLSNDGQGGSPEKIPAEFSKVHHARGILSAARTNDPNSASSQFFICVADAGFLDNQYTVYGQVIEGMEVADKIVALPKNGNDNPGKESVMTKVYIVGDGDSKTKM